MTRDPRTGSGEGCDREGPKQRRAKPDPLPSKAQESLSHSQLLFSHLIFITYPSCLKLEIHPEIYLNWISTESFSIKYLMICSNISMDFLNKFTDTLWKRILLVCYMQNISLSDAILKLQTSHIVVSVHTLVNIMFEARLSCNNLTFGVFHY